MPVDWCVQALRRDHDRAQFGCGEPTLDEYLSNFARQNHESGVARTFVAVREAEPSRILGYYSLAVGSIDRANLPQAAARRFPNFPCRSRDWRGLRWTVLSKAKASERVFCLTPWHAAYASRRTWGLQR